MELDNPPVMDKEVPVTPVRLVTVLEKLEVVDSLNPYDVAPLDEFQVRFGVRGTPICPLVGDTRTGATGAVKNDVGVEGAHVVPRKFTAPICQ